MILIDDYAKLCESAGAGVTVLSAADIIYMPAL